MIPRKRFQENLGVGFSASKTMREYACYSNHSIYSVLLCQAQKTRVGEIVHLDNVLLCYQLLAWPPLWPDFCVSWHNMAVPHFCMLQLNLPCIIYWKTLFSFKCSESSCHKFTVCRCEGLFQACLLYPVDLCVYFCSVYHVFLAMIVL